MPDYGTKSSSGTGASDKSYTKGSGYTAPSLNKSGSKASQRRKKSLALIKNKSTTYPFTKNRNRYDWCRCS